MSETISTDIAIIGAGIAGAGFAAALANAGRTLLIEQESRPGYHATARSAAVFIQNYGNDAIRTLTAASREYFRSIGPAAFGAPLLSPRQIVFVADAASRDHLDELLAAAQGLREIGPEEALALVPILRRDWLAGAALEEDASDIDVDALHQGWLRKAKDDGATLLTEAPVTAGERRDGRWLLETRGGLVSARIVVNAAGAWADAVARCCGIAPLGLTPLRRSMAVLPAPAGFETRHWPLTADAADRWYMKPETGRLLVSPADEDPVEPHDAYADDMVLAEGLYRFEQAVTIPIDRVEGNWAGLRTFAPDRTPVAGFDPSGDGFFWLAGQGGYGMQTAPALSSFAAALVEERPLPAELEALVPALSPARFS